MDRPRVNVDGGGVLGGRGPANAARDVAATTPAMDPRAAGAFGTGLKEPAALDEPPPATTAARTALEEPVGATRDALAEPPKSSKTVGLLAAAARNALEEVAGSLTRVRSRSQSLSESTQFKDASETFWHGITFNACSSCSMLMGSTIGLKRWR